MQRKLVWIKASTKCIFYYYLFISQEFYYMNYYSKLWGRQDVFGRILL